MKAALRLSLACALLGAGAWCLPRLPLQAASQASFPELTVAFAGAPTLDPDDVRRRALVPLEREVRALGGIRGVAGEVRPGGAEIRVRLAPGVDPEVKATLLARNLAAARIAAGSGRFTVRPGSVAEGDLLAVLWLGQRDDRATEALAEALRRIPGIRSVERHGGTREQLRFQLPIPPGAEATEIRNRIERSLLNPALGLLPSRRGGEGDLAVRLAPDGDDFGAIAIAGGVRLADLARPSRVREPLPSQVHLQGKPGRGLWIWREHEAPPLQLSRALRQALAALRLGGEARLLLDEAGPLRDQLARLGLGALLAAIACALLGWRLGRKGAGLALGAIPPLALAAIVVALRLRAGGMRGTGGIDAAALPAILLALGAATLFGLSRAFAPAGRAGDPARRLLGLDRDDLAALTALALAAAPGLAAWLAPDLMPPLLAASCRLFALAACAGIAGVALLPSIASSPVPIRGDRSGRWLRAALRDPGTAILSAAALAFLSFAFFGSALAPREGGAPPGAADLALRFDAPAGSTLAETEERVERLERMLDREGRIAGHWSDFDASQARIELRLAPSARTLAGREQLVSSLRLTLPGSEAIRFEGATATASSELPLGDELEQRAESDADASRYRLIVHAATLETRSDTILRYAARLRELKLPKLADLGLRTTPSVYIELAPASRSALALAPAVAGALAQASAPPPSWSLPHPPGQPERTLLVVPAGAPTDPETVPQRADLLHRALPIATAEGVRVATASALFRPGERLVPSRSLWQAGRFVQLLDLELPAPSKAGRQTLRDRLDRSFASLPLRLGDDLERPDLSWPALHRTQLRRAALFALLPLLWLAWAALRLDAVGAALATLAPAVLGIAAAAPFVWAGSDKGGGDEITLFALAASLAATLPFGFSAAAAIADRRKRSGPSGERVGRAGAYRELRQTAPLALGGGLVFALLALVPTLGADPIHTPWAVALRAAAACGAATASAFFLLPALLPPGASIRLLRRRGRRPAGTAERGDFAPLPAGPPSLSVQNLSKAYRGGFRALSQVSFDLQPGIVGLLGPNGAGKTTLIRTLVGLLEPSRGRILYGGQPLGALDRAAYRRRIGFLPQDFNAYPGFTAEGFLDYWATARELPQGPERRREIEELLATVGLAEHGRRRVRDFSGGMRRRLGIAGALLGKPPILIVDEPTTGLDIESRHRFRDTLLAVAGERIVLLSTHIASDVEAVAGRILVLQKGRVIFDGPPAELIERTRGTVFEKLVDDAELRDLAHRYQVTNRVRLLAGVRVRAVARPGQELPGPAVTPSLEEAYLAAQRWSDAG